MGEFSKIEWTHHTFNPWIGCQKVSAGCDHCYAEQLADRRYHWVEWGPHGKRRRTSAANWRKPLAWNRAAQIRGKRTRVFCASLADVFDNKAPPGARDDLFSMIRQTPCLDWQLLTKRPENIPRFLPADWGHDGYANVWLGITCEDSLAWIRRWPVLARIPAAIRFVSYEPAIGPLDMSAAAGGRVLSPWPDWLICGGESGPGARTMDWMWAQEVKRQCKQCGVAFFLKQWGHYRSNPIVQAGGSLADARSADPPSNGKGGALLDSRLWREFPQSPADAPGLPAFL